MAALLCLSFSAAAAAAAQDIPSFVNSETPALVDTYKDIHAHPELSHFEARTSAILAAELSATPVTPSPTASAVTLTARRLTASSAS